VRVSCPSSLCSVAQAAEVAVNRSRPHPRYDTPHPRSLPASPSTPSPDPARTHWSHRSSASWGILIAKWSTIPRKSRYGSGHQILLLDRGSFEIPAPQNPHAPVGSTGTGGMNRSGSINNCIININLLRPIKPGNPLVRRHHPLEAL